MPILARNGLARDAMEGAPDAVWIRPGAIQVEDGLAVHALDMIVPLGEKPWVHFEPVKHHEEVDGVSSFIWVSTGANCFS